MGKKIFVSILIVTLYSCPSCQITSLFVLQFGSLVLNYKFINYTKRYIRIVTILTECAMLGTHISVMALVFSVSNASSPSATAIALTEFFIVGMVTIFLVFIIGNFLFEMPIFLMNIRSVWSYLVKADSVS